eukprot:TRINITY_DN468_c0_g2_i1.p1 TRINITY_DN468_c0_g2~~TRINITY_DN468_c0_g2_i1.p1  ORF type:complete len:617 (-),score=225.69 TRINITY_DN468_c0_g2_i1:199-2049(-)
MLKKTEQVFDLKDFRWPCKGTNPEFGTKIKVKLDCHGATYVTTAYLPDNSLQSFISSLLRDLDTLEKEALSNEPSGLFGVSLSAILKRSSEKQELPRVIIQIIDYLQNNGLNEEGIFRLSCAKEKLDEIKRSIDFSGKINCATIDNITLAVLIKNWLSSLPISLIPPDYQDGCKMVANQPKECQTRILKRLIADMPIIHKAALDRIFKFLHSVSLNSEQNKMTAENLSISLGTAIMKPEESVNDDLDKLQAHIARTVKVVAILIDEYDTIFSVDEGLMKMSNVANMNNSIIDSKSNISQPAIMRKVTGIAALRSISTLIEFPSLIERHNNLHQSDICAMGVRNDYQIATTIDSTGLVICWNPQTNNIFQKRNFETRLNTVKSLILNEDNLWISSEQGLYVFNVTTGGLVKQLLTTATSCMIELENKIWISTGNTINIYDAMALNRVKTVQQSQQITALFSYGVKVFCGLVNGTINILNMVTYRSLQEIVKAHEHKIIQITFAKGNIWTLSENHEIKIWNEQSMNFIKDIVFSIGGITKLQSFELEVWLFNSGGGVVLIDSTSFEPIRKPSILHKSLITAVIPTYQNEVGRWCCWTCADKSIAIWLVESSPLISVPN